MKKRFLSVLILFICGNIVVSCNGCENKNNDPLPVQPPNATATSSEVINDSDSQINYNSGAAQTSNTKVSSLKENGENKANGVTAAKKPAREINKITDYSAPNGTDAENHDGDPYTKNDTTPMPTGTSIR